MKFPLCEKALMELIEGEATAVATYNNFAITADKENLPTIAKLFRALAKAENIHIENHNRALGYLYKPASQPQENRDTISNIIAALAGETEECKTLYPSLIKSIKPETKEKKGKVAQLSMIWASKAEKIHAQHLKLALTYAKQKKDLEAKKIFVCRVCGNVEIDPKAEKECVVCGHDFIFFEREA